MALGLMTRNIRFSGVTGAQFVSRHLSGLFSYFGHFLHSFGKQFVHATRALLALSSAKQGEQFKKHPVHHVVHHYVHPMPLVTHWRIKKFRTTASPSRARVGRVLGWNDPTFFPMVRQKRFSESFQPTLAGLKEARLHTFTT